MKDQSIILLVFCLVSVTLAKPPPIFLEYKDSLGQYSFGYSAPDSARSEVRSLDGSTRGSYSYVDDAGIIQSTQYTADKENGFQVIATNLPQAPRAVVDTPEVISARREHLKAFEEAEMNSAQINKEDNDEDKIDGKSDTVIIEDAEAKIAEAKIAEAKINKETKTDKLTSDDSENLMEIQERTSADESETGMMEKEMEKGVEKAIEKESVESIQEPQSRAVESDVPVVTTSFVIPGTVNLHTKIHLDQRSARLALESSGLPIYRTSSIQGSDNLDPSMLTPAGTKMMTPSSSSSSSEKMDLLMKTAETLQTETSPDFYNYKQRPYSVSYVPQVIGHSNYVAVPYTVDSSPIYAHYNPYQYFPFGLL